MPRKSSKSKEFLLGKKSLKGSYTPYEVGKAKGEWETKTGFVIGKGFVYDFCNEIFEEVTGIQLKMGELVKVKLVIIDE